MLIKVIIEYILSYFYLTVSKIDFEDVKSFTNKIRVKDLNYQLVRIGEKNDGGYLVPEKILNKNKYLLSAGVGNTTLFEQELKNSYQIESFMIDHSVDLDLSKYNFTKKKIGFFDNNTSDITLNSWIENCKKNHNLNLNETILKLDIEGFEIEAILNISEEYLSKFTILIVEFHNFSALKNKVSLKIYNIVFDKILKYFEVCHIHPNNYSDVIKIKNLTIPHVMEFTFLNKRFCSNINKNNKKKYPLLEDAKTINSKKEIFLSEDLIQRN